MKHIILVCGVCASPLIVEPSPKVIEDHGFIETQEAPKSVPARGKLSLATVIDMFSRRLLGHAMGEHHDAALATASLQQAVATSNRHAGWEPRAALRLRVRDDLRLHPTGVGDYKKGDAAVPKS